MNIEEKILVYVGANKGDGLLSALWNNPGSFTKAYVFEPDPEMFEILFDRYTREIAEYQRVLDINTDIYFLNYACSDVVGERTLYIHENRVSTSLGNFVPSPNQIIQKIKVNAINLYEYLIKEGVTKINYLVTDTQGSDLTILKTLKPYIISKNIDVIYTETQNDSNQWYEGLDNSFSGFKNLLSEYYDIAFFDDYYNNDRHKNENILGNAKEWDTCWVVKK